MPSLSTTLLSTLAASSSVLANPLQQAQGQRRDASNCPGVNFNRNGVTGCCVGGTIDSPYLSVCEGWPICQGPTTTTWTATPISCATIVTDGAGYDAAISSARASIEKSGTRLVTPLDGVTASQTGGNGGDADSSTAAATTTANASPGRSSSEGAGATVTKTVADSGAATTETATGTSAGGAAATSESAASAGSGSGSSTTTSSGAAAATSEGAAAEVVARWGVAGGAVMAFVAALF